ncbi:MAG: ATP-binding protein [Chlamydiales bacterium]|nr:ATP-binding protein [Chlamydiales bacterium]
MKNYKRFQASIDQLPQILKWIRIPLEELCFACFSKMQIEVALEEVLVNIIQYAYLDKIGEIDIAYEMQENHEFCIIIKDSGKAFNPLEHACSTIKTVPLEERQIGGLGIPFIMRIMDKVEYQRENNQNVLTLIKHCQPVQ